MKRRQGYVYIACILCTIFFISCKERNYLKDAVQCKAILCYRLFTEGCKDTLFVCNVPDKLEEDLTENFDIKDAGRYIYRHIKDSIPIQVSKMYYLKQYDDSLQFKEDSLMQSIYEEEGVAGLFKNYFRLSYKIYVFRNEQERFPFVGKKPFPAFGKNQNLDWMSYLLSKHNIYLNLNIIEGTLFVIIDPCCSDMKAVKRYWEESKELLYRRDPYSD